MDNFRVALDGLHYSLLLIDEPCRDLIGFEPMDHQVNVFDIALEPLTILPDYPQVDVIVVDGLALLDVLLVVEDEGEEFVVAGDEVVEEGLEGVADGELSVGDGADEGGGVEDEVQEVVVCLHVWAFEALGQSFILVDGIDQFVNGLQI